MELTHATHFSGVSLALRWPWSGQTQSHPRRSLRNCGNWTCVFKGLSKRWKAATNLGKMNYFTLVWQSPVLSACIPINLFAWEHIICIPSFHFRSKKCLRADICVFNAQLSWKDLEFISWSTKTVDRHLFLPKLTTIRGLYLSQHNGWAEMVPCRPHFLPFRLPPGTVFLFTEQRKRVSLW